MPISEKLSFAGTLLIAIFLIPCFYIDAVNGTNEEQRTYLDKTIDLGYLVENKLLSNRVRIKELVAEIESIKREDKELLQKVLEANGVQLKENEGCDYNLEERRFMFYDIGARR